MNLLFFGVLFATIPAVSAEQTSHFNKATKSVRCAEPIPEFTLSLKSNPSNSEVEKLCSCIWSKFPENGWERDVSTAAAQGKNPGPRVKEFIGRFGETMKQCGAYNL